MGYIYKIINNINGKVYVGQTARSVQIRWYEHCKNSIFFNTHLYKAMRKYGLDNFSICTLEECTNEQLNEREIYWINYYDSMKQGYNETLGGEGKILYDRNLITDLYNQGYNCQEISNLLNCCVDTVRSILKECNVTVLSGGEVCKKRKQKAVLQLDKNNNIICKFDSIQDAARSLNRDILDLLLIYPMYVKAKEKLPLVINEYIKIAINMVT